MAEGKTLVTKNVELTKPHTDGSRDYAPGAILKLHKDQADWLIGNDRAKEAPAGSKPAND